MTTSKPTDIREFWIYGNDDYGPMYCCDYGQRGFVPERTFNPTHVIEYRAVEQLKDENEKLNSALNYQFEKYKELDSKESDLQIMENQIDIITKLREQVKDYEQALKQIYEYGAREVLNKWGGL